MMVILVVTVDSTSGKSVGPTSDLRGCSKAPKQPLIEGVDQIGVVESTTTTWLGRAVGSDGIGDVLVSLDEVGDDLLVGHPCSREGRERGRVRGPTEVGKVQILNRLSCCSCHW